MSEIKLQYASNELTLTDELLNAVKQVSDEAVKDGRERSFPLCLNTINMKEVVNGEVCVGSSCSTPISKKCPVNTDFIGTFHTHQFTTTDWSPGDILMTLAVSKLNKPAITCRYAAPQRMLQCDIVTWLPTIPTLEELDEKNKSVDAFYDEVERTGEPPMDDFPPEFYELKQILTPVVKTLLIKKLK